ncbi:MAG: GGDEF domain-containing protein [Nitrospirae bacterium]|nr:GGDEF domain-containing protein [Nitrospirota bacterium]MBI3594131.1 GGDEF domain-containing protein [Nitrospirota bacterium]
MRFKFSITQKLFLSYTILILLSLLIGTYAMSRLNALKVMSNQIIHNGIPQIYISEKMIECILAQQVVQKRYFVLRSKVNQEQFDLRGEEFNKYLEEMRGKGIDEELGRISKGYGEYLVLFTQAVTESNVNYTQLVQDQKELEKRSDFLIKRIQFLKNSLMDREKEKLVSFDLFNQRSFYLLVVLSGMTLFFGFSFVFFVTSYFSKTIQKIKQTTQMISKGKYDNFPILSTEDEVGELAESFKAMGERLKELEAINLDANPLTRLPGNLAIEKELLKKIQSRGPLAFCLLDLDNFKAYGDTYGYAKGSEVLTVVAGILRQVIESIGRKDDFIGHIGGDDFVLITDPARVHTLCQRIITEFDQTIPFYYDESDRANGFIVAKDRKEVEQKFPLMTISIAVVTNEKRKFHSADKIAEQAAQLKHYAKTFPKSIYVIDQRRI